MGDRYQEDEVINLPSLKSIALTIGDLWDCRKSCPSGGNLFTSEIGEKHLNIVSYQDEKLCVRHLKNNRDKLNSIELTGGLGADILGGLLKIEGELEFEKKASEKLDTEELLISHELHTYKIELLPCAKEVVDPFIEECLLEEKISATHVVSEVTLGSVTQGSLKIWNNSKENSERIKAKVSGTISIVLASATASIWGEISTLETVSEIGTSINVSSKPPIKKPPTCSDEMQSILQEISEKIKKELHFEQMLPNQEIYGIPIKITLIPITELVPKLESHDSFVKCYKLMKLDEENRFISTLAQIKDMINPDYLKKIILQEAPTLFPILSDQNHQISIEISQKEIEISQQVSKFLEKLLQTFSQFKLGIANQKDISQVLDEFYEHFQNLANYKEIISAKARQEIWKVSGATGGDNKNVEFFTNSHQMTKWLNNEDVGLQILLKTGDLNQDEIYKLCSMASENLKISIAYPSVCPESCMIIKSVQNVKIFTKDQIPFNLNILKFLFSSECTSNGSIFYKILCEIKGILNVNFEQISNFTSVFASYGDIFICENYLQTREKLREFENEDFKIVLLTNGANLYESVENFLYLKNEIGEKFICKWLIGSLSTSKEILASPILILGTGNTVLALCLDKFDLFKIFKDFSTKSVPDWVKFLPSCEIENSLSEIFQNLLISMDFGCFSEGISENFENFHYAKSIQKNYIYGKNFEILNILIEICIRKWPDLKARLKILGGEENFGQNYQKFLTNCDNFVDELYPILSDVRMAIMYLSCEETKFESEQVEKLIKNPNCPENLKSKLRFYSKNFNFSKKLASPYHLRILQEYLDTIYEMDQLIFITILKKIVTNSGNSGKILISREIKNLLISQILENFDQNKTPYKLLSHLERNTNSKFYKFHREISKLHRNFENYPEIMQEIVQNIENDWTLKEKLAIWGCEKFIYMIEKASIDQEFLNFIVRKCTGRVPIYYPKNLQIKISEKIKLDKWTWDPNSRGFGGQRSLIEEFQAISFRNEMPYEFNNWLSEFLRKNQNSLDFLTKAQALYFWDSENNFLCQPWDLQIVKESLNQINLYQKTQENEKIPNLVLPKVGKFIEYGDEIKLNEFWSNFLQIPSLKYSKNLLNNFNLDEIPKIEDIVLFILKTIDLYGFNYFLENCIKCQNFIEFDINTIWTILLNFGDLEIIIKFFNEFSNSQISLPFMVPSMTLENSRLFYPINLQIDGQNFNIFEKHVKIICLVQMGSTYRDLNGIIFKRSYFQNGNNKGFIECVFMNNENCSQDLKNVSFETPILILNIPKFEENLLNFLSEITSTFVFIWDVPNPEKIFREISNSMKKCKSLHLLILDDIDEDFKSKLPLIDSKKLHEPSEKLKIVQIFTIAFDQNDKFIKPNIFQQNGIQIIGELSQNEKKLIELLSSYCYEFIKNNFFALQRGKYPHKFEDYMKFTQLILNILVDPGRNSFTNILYHLRKISQNLEKMGLGVL